MNSPMHTRQGRQGAKHVSKIPLVCMPVCANVCRCVRVHRAGGNSCD
jgi:hypothetical protein